MVVKLDEIAIDAFIVTIDSEMDKIISDNSIKIESELDKIYVFNEYIDALKNRYSEFLSKKSDSKQRVFIFESDDVFSQLKNYVGKQPTTNNKTKVFANIFEAETGFKTVYTRTGMEMLISYVRDNCKPDDENKSILDAISSRMKSMVI